MADVLKLSDYVPPKTPVEGFAVINREHLLDILDAVVGVNGATLGEHPRDLARKLHFGLVHGLGAVQALVDQAREEEREACAKICDFWADCNRDAFRDQALAAECCAQRIRERSGPKESGET